MQKRRSSTIGFSCRRHGARQVKAHRCQYSYRGRHCAVRILPCDVNNLSKVRYSVRVSLRAKRVQIRGPVAQAHQRCRLQLGTHGPSGKKRFDVYLQTMSTYEPSETSMLPYQSDYSNEGPSNTRPKAREHGKYPYMGAVSRLNKGSAAQESLRPMMALPIFR